jgi:hypothetical protein
MKALLRCSSLSLVASVLFSGCASVVSERPVGEQPVKLHAATWNQTWIGWLDDVQAITIKTEIKDADRGIVAWHRIHPEGVLNDLPTDGVLHIRQFGKVVVANYEFGKGHYFGRVAIGDRSFTLFAPVPPKFVKLIEDRKLEGKIEVVSLLGDGKLEDKIAKNALKSCGLRGFPDKVLTEVEAKGESVFDLFEKDPILVFVVKP